jgi:hypothetical protein
MISVTAQAGVAKATATATAASCKNVKADFTIEPFQSAAVETRFPHVKRSHKAMHHWLQSGRTARSAQLTIA